MKLLAIGIFKPDRPTAIGSASLAEAKRREHASDTARLDAQALTCCRQAKIYKPSEIADTESIRLLLLMDRAVESGEDCAFLRRQWLTKDEVGASHPFFKELALAGIVGKGRGERLIEVTHARAESGG